RQVGETGDRRRQGKAGGIRKGRRTDGEHQRRSGLLAVGRGGIDAVEVTADEGAAPAAGGEQRGADDPEAPIPSRHALPPSAVRLSRNACRLHCTTSPSTS